ncbi:hypothetical protein, partial [Klebsiella pneumoniae]|uniref:hypothetical protein n=1 Tax=Klebsiella pneumoniae TaxID=573 RepID=UPI001D0E65BB
MRLRNKSCRLLGIGAITLRHIGCRRRCLLRDKNMVQDGASLAALRLLAQHCEPLFFQRLRV